MTPLQLHPVDWFNTFGSFKDIFKGEKEDACNVKSDTEACYSDPDNLSGIKHTTYQLIPSGQISVLKNNPHGISSGIVISKFTLLSAIKFKSDFRAAESYVMYKLMELNVPYARIGTSYYMIENKKNRYGGFHASLNIWKKDELKEDFSKNILKIIPKYNGFCIEPDNTTHSLIHNNRYNLYAPFPHAPHTDHVNISEIPNTIHLIKHIFGDQFALGLKYFKLLYEKPKQILPILALVSEERETGKTTFINYVSMLFCDNSVLINPQQLTGDFNSSYATKNIIMIDEATFEKDKAVEKLKSLATAKEININEKFIQQYQIPFFGKIIMCSNKEKKFMRIDNAEIRFWIRKIPRVTGIKNVEIEQDLFDEIPKFIKYLTQLPAIDTSKTRMVFTPEEIGTTELIEVKNSSKTWLVKDLQILIDDWFDNHDADHFYAGAKDIHEEWFTNDRQTRPHYISEVLKEEMKMKPVAQLSYHPFDQKGKIQLRKVSTPFLFKRQNKKFKENDDL